ncbi:transposase [Actinacidiphila oryziradicis]|uniref:Transposase n=1 Tax=Actinacidiphila oryziradicis TaxID=2571141 RepID=A0A4U0RKJ5_9ACTN|nr:transposase [Actinacidiphila oryziradicis]
MPAPNSGASSCDCLAHRRGNAADKPDRKRHYPTCLTDTQWAVVRDALPMPRWLEGRGGRPDSYFHRAMLDAVFYLVHGGIKWRSMPCDFLCCRFFRRYLAQGC